MVAVKTNDEIVTRLSPNLQLSPGTELIMVGSDDQVDLFVDAFG